MSRKLHLIGWGTLLGFPLAGFILLKFFGLPLIETVFRWKINVTLQLGAGAFIGVLMGLGAKRAITLPAIAPTLDKYSDMIRSMGLKQRHVFFLSFCAGFGEELFFRGALQPLAGIWITAIVFVAIHGYLNPMNWRISLYGIYMTGVIAVLGYLTELWGIFTACAAHTAIDIVLFNFLIARAERQATPNISQPYAETED